MCPFCIGSAVLMAGGFMSAGGLTALVVKEFRSKGDERSRHENCGFDLDGVGSGSTNDEASLGSNSRRQTRLETPREILFSGPTGPAHSVRAGQRRCGSGAGQYGSPELSTAGAPEPPGRLRHFLQEPRECEGHPEENG